MKAVEHTDPWDCDARPDDDYGQPCGWILHIDPSMMYYDRDSLTVWSGERIKELMKQSKNEKDN